MDNYTVTNMTIFWRSIMKNLYLLLGHIFLIGYSPLNYANKFQSITSIQEATRQYVVANLNSSSDYQFKVNQLDSRLKLPLCTQPLQASTARKTLKAGRNSIEIRCNSKKKWAIYTSAIINIYKEVIVLTQPIQRGEFYREDSIRYERKNLVSLRAGFIIDKNKILNKQATRNLSVGAVISQSNITEPRLIKRGERVTINLSSGNFEITVAGIALMDGKKNQNIRIKNIKTKQIVQATVVRQGLVVVPF